MYHGPLFTFSSFHLANHNGTRAGGYPPDVPYSDDDDADLNQFKDVCYCRDGNGNRFVPEDKDGIYFVNKRGHLYSNAGGQFHEESGEKIMHRMGSTWMSKGIEYVRAYFSFEEEGTVHWAVCKPLSHVVFAAWAPSLPVHFDQIDHGPDKSGTNNHIRNLIAATPQSDATTKQIRWHMEDKMTGIAFQRQKDRWDARMKVNRTFVVRKSLKGRFEDGPPRELVRLMKQARHVHLGIQESSDSEGPRDNDTGPDGYEGDPNDSDEEEDDPDDDLANMSIGGDSESQDRRRKEWQRLETQRLDREQRLRGRQENSLQFDEEENSLSISFGGSSSIASQSQSFGGSEPPSEADLTETETLEDMAEEDHLQDMSEEDPEDLIIQNTVEDLEHRNQVQLQGWRLERKFNRAEKQKQNKKVRKNHKRNKKSKLKKKLKKNAATLKTSEALKANATALKPRNMK